MWWLQGALGLALLPKIWAQTDAFEFSWPGTTDQCGTYDLTWNGGLPPFRAFFVPIDGAPIIYDLPDSAYSRGSGRHPILHQFPADTPYVVYMSDANGDGTGGSSILQVTRPGSSSCELLNSSNHTAQSFSFVASGSLAQCSNSFNLAWDYTADNAPYNVSIVPLDQSFRPFTVRMSDRAQGDINWRINLQAGINFTIMFNDADGYGTGGTGGIYRVNLDSDMPSNCGALVLAAAQNALPAGLTTASLPPAPSTTGSETASVTGSRTGRPTGPAVPGQESSSGGLSGGAIAGIVIGVIAGLLLLLLLLFCLYRRRRNRDSERLSDYASNSSPDDMQETNRNSVGVLPTSISRNLTYGHGHSRNISTTSPQLADFGGFEQSEVPRDAQPTVVPFMPQSTSMSASTSDEQAEDPRRRSKLAMSMASQPTFRVSNGFIEGPTTPTSPTRETAVTRRSTMDLSSLDIPEDDSMTTYRRMTDGGRFVASPEEGGRTVDLPPLYNDIPRDGPAGERRD